MNLRFTGKFGDYEVQSLRDELIYAERHAKNDIERIYKLIEPLSNDYPKHEEWFYKKHVANVLHAYIPDEHREVLFIHKPTNYIPESLNIIGTVCLKINPNERKICCLYVDEQWRNKGIGIILLQCAFRWLGTSKPLITFPDYKLEEMKPLIDKYGWKLEETLDDPYGTGHKELCFNGKLVPEPERNYEQITIDHVLKLKNKDNKKSAE
jgi:GNAT superfamily N-acetyltransferase